MMQSIFLCACWPFVYLLCSMSIQILCPFLIWVICLFNFELQKFFFLHILDLNVFTRYLIYKYFFSNWELSIHFVDDTLCGKKFSIFIKSSLCSLFFLTLMLFMSQLRNHCLTQVREIYSYVYQECNRFRFSIQVYYIKKNSTEVAQSYFFLL